MRTSDIKALLDRLNTAEIKALAVIAKVAERTLWNIRKGDTKSARETIQDKIVAGLRHLPKRGAK